MTIEEHAERLAEALEALVNSFEKHRPKQLWDDARTALASYNAEMLR